MRPIGSCQARRHVEPAVLVPAEARALAPPSHAALPPSPRTSATTDGRGHCARHRGSRAQVTTLHLLADERLLLTVRSLGTSSVFACRPREPRAGARQEVLSQNPI
jgi:hypothetical protein